MIVSAYDAQTFNWAVAKAEDWVAHGSHPSLASAGSAIEDACGLMIGCKEAMPEGLHKRLKDMAVRLYLVPPVDRRYATGAACLREIVARLREKAASTHGVKPSHFI